MNTFVVASIPLEGNIEILALAVIVFEVAYLRKEWFFGLIEVLDKVNNSTLVLEGDLLFTVWPFVRKADFEATVQKGHDLQAIKNRSSNKFGSFGLKDRWVRPKGHGRT
jgi:hypothetical protein